MQPKHRQSNALRISCPHCGSKAAIRTSKEVSLITRELYFQCTNHECGHTWTSLLSAIRTIVPSQLPNPAVFIPLSDKARVPEPSPSG